MVGRTVHQYQFLEKLGAGGMGDIYKAQDTRLGRFVAVKVLSSSTSGDPERRRRFLQEAQSASALNHPNIITIHDIVSDGDAQFMVMEHVQGKTLVDLIPKGGLRVPQVLKYSVQMADALAAAHSAGIIHRDLKPGNIMATESGLVKILDFGLAKLMDRGPLSSTNFNDNTQTIADAPLTVEGAIIGTVSYMSPEQAQGRKIDARSDIFSMGLVMYEMATGARAFTGDSALSTLSAILRDEARSITLIAPDVPRELEEVIARCLRKNPDDRWQTMQDLQRALAALKYESDSGVLYRSRLSGIVAPAPPPLASAASAQGSHAPQPPPPPMQPVSSAPPPPSSFAGQAPYVPPPSAPSYLPPSQMRVPQPPSQMPVMPPRPPKKSSAGLVIGLVAGALVLLGGAGGGYWWWTHRTPAPEPETIAETPAQPGAPAVEPPPPEPVAPVTPPVEAAKNPPPAPVPVPQQKQAKAPVAPPAAQKSRPAPATTPPPVVVAEQPAPAPVPAPVAPPPPKPVALATVTASDGLPLTISLGEAIPENAEEGKPLRFIATTDFRSGDVVVISKGATITGQIVDGGRKRLIGSSKMTLKLIDAETNGGGKIRLRALPGRRADGKYVRPVDTGVKNKPKDIEAPAGTEYIAYIDGEQSVSVHK